MELDLVKPHDLRILMRNVESKIRIHYYHRQFALSLKKKKKKKLLLHSHLLMSQAAYLAVCSPCQNSFSIFSPWHEGQATHLVLVTQGCFPSASKLFSLYQLGTWRIQLFSCSILASHPLREASLLLCP